MPQYLRFLQCLAAFLLPSLLFGWEASWIQDVNSAQAAMERGDTANAESYLELAVKVARQEATLDARLAAAYESLADHYRREKLYAESAASLERAVALWKETTGTNQPPVAAALNRLADLRDREERPTEAEPLRIQAIAILELRYGDDHPCVAVARAELAASYAGQSRLEEADEQYRKALAIANGAFGATAMVRTRIPNGYLRFLRKANRHADAAQVEASFRQLDPSVFRLDGDTTAPRLVTKKEPQYTDEARDLHVEGRVGLSVIIDENGVPSDIWVMQPLGFGLDEKAVDAVSAWRFEPAQKDGKAVPVVSVVEVNFRLL